MEKPMRNRLLALLPIALAACSAAPAFAQLAPAQSTPPAVTPAPGRGVIPSVSAHNAAAPMLYDVGAQPIEQVSPLIQRQYLSGSQSTIVKWTVEAGAVFPLHHHANEQITWITQGRCEVFSQENRYVLTAGSVLIIPPNVPHEFRCTEDSIDIDFFAPARQDWADGAPSVAARP
ncbi:cupin domain-containing protein [Teichococcus wenyumeiae]|nr:cupin domain-containing protein [Pseudoroseomonas wenyumeiae]